MFVIFLTVSFFSWLFGFAFATYLFRKVFRLTSAEQAYYENSLFLKEREIEQKTLALREVMRQIQHYGGNPILKRFRGLRSVCSEWWRNLYENMALAQKPNHHRYAELALVDLRKIDDIWLRSVDEAEKLEEEILKTARTIEDLQ